jgi:microcystin-dependent protein
MLSRPGVVVAFVGNESSIPSGWLGFACKFFFMSTFHSLLSRLSCDGKSYLTSSFPTLAQVLSAQGSNFFVPDLRGRAILGRGSKLVGYQGGLEAVSLSLPELPSHSHAINASNDIGTQSNPSNNVLAQDSNGNPYATSLCTQLPCSTNRCELWFNF